ncbi:hypothetical protein [Streptomyces sp. NRRL S-337]|uniref:hypothetical protein n=1 Tax=Streptomyces sp. NRRL S-337 TaxID=1463900 RepID=UPI0004CBFF52|nr:hypothetical protein [Streptomyces sp. NRRL S-337]
MTARRPRLHELLTDTADRLPGVYPRAILTPARLAFIAQLAVWNAYQTYGEPTPEMAADTKALHHVFNHLRINGDTRAAYAERLRQAAKARRR